MVGEACLPSNAYYPRTPDYTLCSGVHVFWSEHSDSSFVYGFMSLDYGFGTMTVTTYAQMTDPSRISLEALLFCCSAFEIIIIIIIIYVIVRFIALIFIPRTLCTIKYYFHLRPQIPTTKFTI